MNTQTTLRSAPGQAIRRSAERGSADFGWLDSRHTFSFGNYHDPNHVGHGPLRVINEDRVQPGRGFDTHGHRDMEILSYVIDGALAHKDSIGTGSVIRPGDLQRMSAGTGVRHSEFNASQDAPVHFLQIWVLPAQNGLAPGYEQKSFSRDDKAGKLKLIGSRDGRDGSVTIHQDVNLYASELGGEQSVEHELADGAQGLGAGGARRGHAERRCAGGGRRRRAGRRAIHCDRRWVRRGRSALVRHGALSPGANPAQRRIVLTFGAQK